jgi:4-alpha-glucanotransferase
MAADRWGILDGYEDALGQWRKTPRETRRAIQAAMRADSRSGAPQPETGVAVVRHGRGARLLQPAELTLEDATRMHVEKSLPPDLPIGYHRLRPMQGSEVLLIVAPPACYVPGFLPTWGWAAQVYALRSRKSWGMGDLGDLQELAHWSARDLGAGILMTNPLHASAPTRPQEPSPYSPSSRRFRNPLYLQIEAIPGAGAAAIDLDPLAAAGRQLNTGRRIDRDAVFRLKMEALGLLWSRFNGSRGFDRYVAEQGQDLHQFAVFCALCEHYAGDWRQWPAKYHRPDSPAVARYAGANDYRVRFHQWLQWLLDEQLKQAAAEIALMQDLPIGFDPGGCDAWAWQDVIASQATVGAPPDEFNTRGQDWGLPPFIPHRLRAASYKPFIQTLRATMQHAGGLRIDHVMGLFRLYWIPEGMDPARGAYVGYPAEELLAILALESHRARVLVVGEDLGTVDESIRRRLRTRKVLSYRLMWFEGRHPRHYPKMALAAVTTHDLPTIAGLWSGSDLETQRTLQLKPNAAGTRMIRKRLRRLTGVAADAPVPHVIERAHQLLAAAPSLILTATLEDALAVDERPNMPGTTTQWPNWSQALPVSLDALKADDLARKVAGAFRRRMQKEK